MRRSPTPGEQRLWAAIRCAQLGVVFRRQVVLQGYIVDFYASACKLIVEVDGGYHAHRAVADARRDRVLRRAGYRVVRVAEEEVMGRVARVARRSLG